MFKKLILKLAGSAIKELTHDLITHVIDNVQEDVETQKKLSEKERATVNMVLDLVEKRAFEFVDSKLGA